MFKSIIALFALFTVAVAFTPARFGRTSTVLFQNTCAEKMLDAKGRCPGDTGYIPIMKEAPTDFAAYMKEQKEKKAKEAAEKGK
jgi:hypothetical protein